MILRIGLTLLLSIMLSGLHAQIGQSTIGQSRKVGVSNMVLSQPAKTGLPVCRLYNACDAPECPVYVFTGSGDWRIAGNWADGMMPPEFLPSCFKIVINPLGNDPCVLQLPQGIAAGASLIVMPGKRIIIGGNVLNQ